MYLYIDVLYNICYLIYTYSLHLCLWVAFAFVNTTRKLNLHIRNEIKKNWTFVPTFVIEFRCLYETGIPLHWLSVYYVSKSPHQWFIICCVMSDVIVTKYYFQDVYTEKSDLWQMRNRTWPKKKKKRKKERLKKRFSRRKI